MLNKEECEKALESLSNPPYESSCGGCICGVSDCGDCPNNKANKVLSQLIDEHFSNPPLYMDEIPKGIWIWDNVNKEFIRSLGCVELDGIIYVKFERSENSFITNYLEYEPNRFYRKEVQE